MTESFSDAGKYNNFLTQLAGRAVSRHQANFVDWYQQSMWNKRGYSRTPEIIVRAQSIDDIKKSVSFAAKQGFTLSVKTGGHNYSGCFLRDNSLLLDVSALRDIQIDKEHALVEIGPGVKSHELSAQLAKQGLAFPTGHVANVSLSGFLIGGGLGINYRAWGGMSTFNILAVDVITADGKLLHASADENADLFWAVRGAGPASFFIVTRFYLKCYPLPKNITNYIHHVPFESLDSVIQMIEKQQWDERLQIMLWLPRMQANQVNHFMLQTIAFTDSESASLALQTSFLQQLPSEILTSVTKDPESSFEKIYQQGAGLEVVKRFCCDNIFTNDMQKVAQIFQKFLPSQPSVNGVTLVAWCGNEQKFPQAAYCAKGKFIISSYLLWDDVSEDLANQHWLHQLYDALAPLASNYYINEFDHEKHSAKIEHCFSAKNWARLCQLRQQYDPDGVFSDVTSLFG